MSETVSQLLGLPEQGSVGMRWRCGFRVLLQPVVLVDGSRDFCEGWSG